MSPVDTVPEMKLTIRALITTAVARRVNLTSADHEGRREMVDLHTRIWECIDKLAHLDRAEAINSATSVVEGGIFAPNTARILAKLHPDLAKSPLIKAMQTHESRERLIDQLSRPHAELVEDLRAHPHRMHRMLDDMRAVLGVHRGPDGTVRTG